MTAPRMGEHMRSQPIGGPACRSDWPDSASASRAGLTATHLGRARQSRSTASRFALPTFTPMSEFREPL